MCYGYLCEAVPGVNFVDVPDVILPSVDGEQASVGVIELKHSTNVIFSLNAFPASALQINIKRSIVLLGVSEKKGELAESLCFYEQ